jgi:tellurite resistance protein
MNIELLKWRCLIALVHADNRVMEQERVLIEEYLDKTSFTPVERKILSEDFLEARDPMSFFEKIPDDQKREVIQLAFALFWADGEFHEAEQKFFKILRKRLG